MTKSGSPSRSDSSSGMNQLRSSANRFWVNCVPSTASRFLISFIRASAVPSNAAPARTKPRWVSISTRACSGVRSKLSRFSQTDATRANSALLLEMSEKCADSSGENLRCRSSRTGLLSAPATVKNTPNTRSSWLPASSSASIVFENVGSYSHAAMASISMRCVCSASSSAGAKSSSEIWSKGAISNGVSQSCSNGFVMAVSFTGQAMHCSRAIQSQ